MAIRTSSAFFLITQYGYQGKTRRNRNHRVSTFEWQKGRSAAGRWPGPPPDRRVHVVVWHRPAKTLKEMIAEGLEEEGELLARMWATVRLRTAQCTRVPSTRSMETSRAVHGGGRRFVIFFRQQAPKGIWNFLITGSPASPWRAYNAGRAS